MTHLEFFEAFEQGQRKFNNLDFEDLEGFSDKDFKYFINADASILEQELTEDDYLKTFDNKMTDVTITAEPEIYIWDFVKQLVYEKIVDKKVFDNKTVELVYRDEYSQFDHILLPTDNNNKFVVIIVKINEPSIIGFYRLDLEKLYGIND